MVRRVLITGVNGFTGRNLAAALRSDPSLDVLGTGRRDRPDLSPDTYRRCDLTVAEDVRSLVAWARPQVIYHLAGLRGGSEPLLHAANVTAFEWLRHELRAAAMATPIRMLVIGSAAEIGPVPADQLPVDERVACRPVTAYGRSKHAVVQSALAEPAESGLEISVARTFNLIGAGLDTTLAPAAFAAQVRACRRGDAHEIRCGWLGGKRDYLDIADAVEAYRLLAEHGRPREILNVCSGRLVRMGEILDMLLAIAGVHVPVTAPLEPSPDDIPAMCGSHARLTALTGWQPRIDLRASLRAILTAEQGRIDVLSPPAAPLLARD